VERINKNVILFLTCFPRRGGGVSFFTGFHFSHFRNLKGFRWGAEVSFLFKRLKAKKMGTLGTLGTVDIFVQIFSSSGRGSEPVATRAPDELPRAVSTEEPVGQRMGRWVATGIDAGTIPSCGV